MTGAPLVRGTGGVCMRERPPGSQNSEIADSAPRPKKLWKMDVDLGYNFAWWASSYGLR